MDKIFNGNLHKKKIEKCIYQEIHLKRPIFELLGNLNFNPETNFFLVRGDFVFENFEYEFFHIFRIFISNTFE